MTKTDAPVRIWYQSFIDVEAQAPYFRRLRAYVDSVKSASTTVDIHGMTPPDRHFHPVTEFRGAAHTIRNAIRAAKEGYDAFVIGHFPDPGLQECRGVVDIPVVGLGEASLLYGCTMGRRIGLVTINPVFVPIHEAQVAASGLQQRVVVRHICQVGCAHLRVADTRGARLQDCLRLCQQGGGVHAIARLCQRQRTIVIVALREIRQFFAAAFQQRHAA